MKSVKDHSQKVFYVCCLLVTTGALCKTLQCPLKDNQMPWKNPCGTEGIEHKSSLPHNAADRTWITNFISVLKEINDFFIELKMLYCLNQTVQFLFIRSGHSDLDSQHLDGFPTVDTAKISNRAKLNVSLEILDDYQKLATVLVFVEQIVSEESFGGTDQDILCNIYYKIRDVLCELRTHSERTLINEVTPTRNVMKSKYRNGDRKAKLRRNYVISKDASSYLRAISNKYWRLYFQI